MDDPPNAETVKDSLTLAPCPFCGGTAACSNIEWNGGAATRAMVICLGDECEANITAPNEARASERWNRRAALAKEARR